MLCQVPSERRALEKGLVAPEAASEAPSSRQLWTSTGIDVGLISDAPAGNFPICEKSRRKNVRCKRRTEQLRCCGHALKLPSCLEPGWAMLLVATTVSLGASSG